MARNLTSGMATEVAAAQLRPTIFYEGEFAGGFLRLWSGLGPIDWNGQTWTGAGNLMAVSPIVETADVRAAPMTCSLSGASPAILSLVLGQARQGKPGKVWFGGMDAAGAIIADPYLAFVGRLDVPQIEDTGETGTVTISYENRLIALERPRTRRWTHEDQQIDYPGDMALEYAASLQNQVLVW
jgi:hypothetical protein